LDQIRSEGVAAGFTSYRSDRENPERANQARSKAYIHLFLKVTFGLLDFRERETFITDGTNDGGIDGYFVDRETRVIFFFQSKFRTTEHNFQNKQITLDEIASMDIARITSGEDESETGNEYNGKIKGLIRTIAQIEDIGRYKYQVILIANLDKVSPTTLRNLTGGFPVEVFDSERCYSELVFPVLSGTYFKKDELSILLDLSNKNAGAKITYEVITAFGNCDITVLFVPTLEIAKTMQKYRNAILKYNPWSYLEFEGAPVNDSIRETILAGRSNEFALLNNGITMISDETNINEKIGQKNKAQLYVKNPQIINGGQTAFTLSRIYQENLSNAEEVFANKEVLLKVITLTSRSEGKTSSNDVQLIELISAATNRQTAVTNTDRHSSDDGFERLQKTVFDRFGVLFERKRGEFGDGLRDGYLDNQQILESNAFAKIYFASNDDLSIGESRRAFLRMKNPDSIASDERGLDRFFYGYRYYTALGKPPMNKKNKGTVRKIAAFVRTNFASDFENETADQLAKKIEYFEGQWERFLAEYNATYQARRAEEKARWASQTTGDRTANAIKYPKSMAQHYQYFESEAGSWVPQTDDRQPDKN
jgi:hypothetical protein